jgi:hypothetical protein
MMTWTVCHRGTTLGISDNLEHFFGVSDCGGTEVDEASQSPKHEPAEMFALISSTQPSEQEVPGFSENATEEEPSLVELKAAAQSKDPLTFDRVVRNTRWSEHSAADLISAIRLALAAGAHASARELALRGHALHPENSRLEKAAHVLAPPSIQVAEQAGPYPVRTNLEWLRVHKEDYQAQWVALENGHLVASAHTARELKEHLGDTSGLFVTRVS